MGRLFLLAAVLMPVAGAHGAVPAAVCRQQTVLDVMTQDVQARWSYARIDPRRVQEFPTPDGMLVRCDVCVKIDQYDMGRYGDQPLGRCEAHRFNVQVVRNGYVVRYLQ
jgi:hypothetical protein